MTAPALAAITLTPGGDGVAAVARLLDDAFRSRWAASQVVTMFSGPARQPSWPDKVAFATRLSQCMFVRRPRWVFFSHLGLTRAQRFVPTPWRRPYAVFLHGGEAWTALKPSDRKLLRGAVLRVANSDYTAAYAMRANPDIGPVVTCHLALPDGCVNSSHDSPPLPIPEQAVVVLIVGALRSNEQYKGHDQLIDAWPSVVAAVPNAHLLIVGDGNDRSRVQSAVQGSGVERSITLLGFVDDDVLAACYRRASLFAMPSSGEGFGLVYLEAMAHGLPCIASRQDAAGEIVRDAVTGLLVDQCDIRGLTAAIVSLLSDADRSRAMGLAGQRRVQADFTTSAFRSRLFNAIDTVFPSNGRHR